MPFCDLRSHMNGVCSGQTGCCWSDLAWNRWSFLSNPRWLWNTVPSSTTHWMSRTALTFLRPSVPTKKRCSRFSVLTMIHHTCSPSQLWRCWFWDCGESSEIQTNHVCMYIYLFMICVCQLCVHRHLLYAFEWICSWSFPTWFGVTSQFLWVVNLNICI